MNRIRKQFGDEVEALYPVLHETYRRIGMLQKRRTERNERRALEQIEAAAPMLDFFRLEVPASKQPYFLALADRSLDLSDRIIALDTAVGAMHIEFAVPRAYMHRESKRLREVLEACRGRDDEEGEPLEGAVFPSLLVRGLGASPGVGVGEAFVAERMSDIHAMPAGSVLVTTMTRPELVHVIERAAAIVTDNGGRLCHAAIIACERGVPCVVGTGNATRRIETGWQIAVDGATGEVTRSAEHLPYKNKTRGKTE